ncbi:MAG: DUF3333 domain-containing protein, partial [Rickettsiales bacterium]|nr:DUF3333 domain-containing protein [Rickettsiales bacterium]
MLNTPSASFYRQRQRAEKRFRFYGQAGLSLAILILVLILGNLTLQGAQGFQQTQLRLPVTFDEKLLDLLPGESATKASASSYQRLAQAAMKAAFPEAADKVQQKQLLALISASNGLGLKDAVAENPALIGQTQEMWLQASSKADLYIKGAIKKETPEADRTLTDAQIAWLEKMQGQGALRKNFNTRFFTQGDSRNPEQAGFLGAMVGSLLTMAVCLSIVFPIGVMTAVYLEEFATRNRWTS